MLAPGLLAFLAWALVSGHVQQAASTLPAPSGGRRRIWRDIREHARLRFPTGAAALRYGVLQKLAYCAVLFVLLPAAILTGLALSPGMDAAWPWLTELWGGRQSARSVHFIAAFALLGFFVVHIAMVLLGPVNQLRAMVTGWYRLPGERE